MTYESLPIGTRVAYGGYPYPSRPRRWPIPVGTTGKVAALRDRGYYAVYHVKWDVPVPGKHALQRYHPIELRVIGDGEDAMR